MRAALWVASFVVVLAACATRLVPRRDADSPASPRAPSAPRRPVAVMLEQDPPLPGADANWGQWPGLDPSVRAPAGHGARAPDQPDAGHPDHSGGHHGH